MHLVHGHLISEGYVCVGQAFLIEHDENAVEFAGNRTECALLMLLRGWGIKYDAIRAEHKSNIFHVYNFTSERKMASMIVRTPEGLRLYNKVTYPSLALHEHLQLLEAKQAAHVHVQLAGMPPYGSGTSLTKDKGVCCLPARHVRHLQTSLACPISCLHVLPVKHAPQGPVDHRHKVEDHNMTSLSLKMPMEMPRWPFM